MIRIRVWGPKHGGLRFLERDSIIPIRAAEALASDIVSGGGLVEFFAAETTT